MKNIINRIQGFLKSFFAKAGESNKKQKNPWAGLLSYEDPSTVSNPLKFCGRDVETMEVFRMIDDNIAITLYGKSGIGKTSLLNAGVFPLLREHHYEPLYIRFGTEKNDEQIFAAQITNVLTTHFEKAYGPDSIEVIDVVEENTDPTSEDYLWSFFARRKFTDMNSRILFPVITLDQFEENIRVNRDQSSILLKQIAYLLNRLNVLKETKVNDKLYIYSYNFRFIISIREDDLYRLEDLININYLSPLKNCRYRLQNLDYESAKAIVRDVGSVCISPEDVDEISKRIIEISKNEEDGLIQTNVISLVCSRLFDIVKKKRGKEKITLYDAETYLSMQPFDEYYSTAVDDLSEGEKKFIETNFVSSDGRRNMVSEESIKKTVKSYNDLTSGETPIFRSVKVTSNKDLIELIHDKLATVVLTHRNRRAELRRSRYLTLTLISYFIIAGYLIWHFLSNILELSWSMAPKERLMQYLSRIIEGFSFMIKEVYIWSLMSAQIVSYVVLIYLLGFIVPKMICKYFYGTVNVKKLVVLILTLIVSGTMASQWLLKYTLSLQTVNFCIAPIIGYGIIIITLLIVNFSHKKKDRNESK